MNKTAEIIAFNRFFWGKESKLLEKDWRAYRLFHYLCFSEKSPTIHEIRRELGMDGIGYKNSIDKLISLGFLTKDILGIPQVTPALEYMDRPLKNSDPTIEDFEEEAKRILGPLSLTEKVKQDVATIYNQCKIKNFENWKAHLDASL